MSDEGAVQLPFRRDSMEIYDMFKWPADVKSEEWDTLTLEQKKISNGCIQVRRL